MIFWMCWSALLGCAIMAGLYFAFSVFVMRALGQIAPEKGMAAMQSINVTILNPLFLLVFTGTAVLSLGISIWTLRQLQTSGAPFLLVASALYLLSVGVTMIFNVPLNDALASAKPDNAHGLAIWANYLVVWTLWNHVRTVATVAGTAFFALGLRFLG